MPFLIPDILLSLFSVLSHNSSIIQIIMYFTLSYSLIILLLKTNFIDFTSNNTHLEIVKSNPTTVLNQLKFVGNSVNNQ